MHLLRYVRNRVGVRTKTPARKAILKLTKELFKVKTLEEANNWDDRQLHYSCNHIKYAKNNDTLWTYLHFPKGVVPRNTNSLEGGVNSHLKQLNFCHRGMRADEEQIMFGWDLIRKSEFGIDGFFNSIKINKTPQGQPFSITFDT